MFIAFKKNTQRDKRRRNTVTSELSCRKQAYLENSAIREMDVRNMSNLQLDTNYP